MDEETVIKIEAEIEESLTVDDASKNLDATDGFIKLVEKQLEKISGKSFFRKFPGASSTASDSSFRKEFMEGQTSLVAGETKRRSQGDSGDSYDFNHANRGLAVIINNEDFIGNYGPRPGSSYDAAALYRTFNKLGFKVLLKTNLTAKQMVDLLKLVNYSYNHENSDCFVCCILTHGNEIMKQSVNKRGNNSRHDILIGTDGEAVYTKVVVDIFSDKNCEGLRGKPRLFFLQACRGMEYDSGASIILTKPARTQGFFRVKTQDKTDSGSSAVDEPDSHTYKRQTSFSSSVDPPEYHQRLVDSTDAKPCSSEEEKNKKGDRSNPSFKSPGETSAYKSVLQVTPVREVTPESEVTPVTACPTPLYKDCLVMYATPPGHYAWRRGTGSWLMQTLCAGLDHKVIRKWSLTKVLTYVSGYIAKTYKSNTPDDISTHEMICVPVIESMLVKDVYFTKKRR